jgi:hypothetical protein
MVGLMTTTQLTGTFRIMGWDEKPYDEPQGLPKLTQTEVCQELEGDITGSASVTYLMGYGDDDAARFVGLVRVMGTIGERTGSFVMQDVGAFENGVAKGRWTILPGLSTGDLRDIRGDGHFAAGADSVSYLLNVSF